MIAVVLFTKSTFAHFGIFLFAFQFFHNSGVCFAELHSVSALTLTEWLVCQNGVDDAAVAATVARNVDETKEMQNKINLVSVFPVHKSYKKMLATSYGAPRTKKKKESP